MDESSFLPFRSELLECGAIQRKRGRGDKRVSDREIGQGNPKPCRQSLTLQRSCFILRVGNTIEYQLKIGNVLSIGLKTRRPMGTKPRIKIRRLRTCDDDSAKRPVETQGLFVAEITAGAKIKERETRALRLIKRREE